MLIVDKPAGMTSAAVVARVKRVLGARRVGHTGTLDPMATGVLPICVGEGTKLAGYLLAADKAYDGELELGVQTDTLDADGEVTDLDPAAAAGVTEADLRAAIAAFEGAIEQVPPAHSAIKQGGRRAYQRARAGEQVELEARPVSVHQISLDSFAPPRARFSVRCSKGTYIRSLVRDIGARLGCGAHLTALRRTQSGPFALAQVIPLDEVTAEAAAARMIAPPDAVAHLPSAIVPPALIDAVRNGQRLPWSAVSPENGEPSQLARLLTPAGALLALATVEDGSLRYARVFTYGLTQRSG